MFLHIIIRFAALRKVTLQNVTLKSVTFYIIWWTERFIEDGMFWERIRFQEQNNRKSCPILVWWMYFVFLKWTVKILLKSLCLTKN